MLLASRSLFNLLESSYIAEKLHEGVDRNPDRPGQEPRQTHCYHDQKMHSFKTDFFKVIKKTLFTFDIDTVD